MKPLLLIIFATLLAACEGAGPETADLPTEGACNGPGAWIITQDADGNTICTPDGW